MKDQLMPVVRAAMLLLSASLIVWAIYPEYRIYVNGLILGMMVSLINAWILKTKIDALTVHILEQDKDKMNTNKRFNMGFISRLCMAIIAVMVAVKMPQSLSVVFTIIGLSFVQLALLLKGLLFRENK